MTIELFRVVLLPKLVVVPYSTWELEASLVVQAIVAPVLVIAELVTPLIVGAVVSGGAEVVKEYVLEVARFPAASLDLTR